jgi:hypothetical protein
MHWVSHFTLNSWVFFGHDRAAALMSSQARAHPKDEPRWWVSTPPRVSRYGASIPLLFTSRKGSCGSVYNLLIVWG